MPVPLALAAPAAAASLAYLNARTGFTSDVRALFAIISGAKHTQSVIDAGQPNMFNDLEERAQAKATANKAFIAVPPSMSPESVPSVEALRKMRPREWTYRQTYDLVLKYAAWLKNEYGIKKDDIVAMDIPNSPEFVWVWFGLWSLGARPAFINTSLRGEGLLHCINISAATLFVVDEDLVEVLSDEVRASLDGKLEKKVTTVILDAALRDRIETMQPHRACDDCRKVEDGNGMSHLIYTSGTTGLPKAANITWRRFHGSAYTIGKYIGVTPETRYFTAMPLYHSSASMLGVGMMLAMSATIIIGPNFSTRTFFPSIIASKANAAQYIGEMCRYLLSAPPSPADTAHGLKFMFGNGIRPDVWPKFRARFEIPRIVEFYGATESPSSTVIDSRNTFGEGAIGRGGLLSRFMRRKISVMVKHDVDSGEPIRDPATGLCIRAEVDEPGEMLFFLDPALAKDSFVGYWRNEKASSSKLVRDVLTKGDTFFRTGDLLRFDSQGRTYFVDRIGDTFRWKGENVSTGEVEKIVAQHPAVQEVTVYGVQLPGHDGRAGCAAVILRSDADEKTLQDLTGFVKKRLPKYAAPLFLRNVKELVTTGTSKYQKAGLRNQGVEPAKVGDDRLFWLSPQVGSYTSFGEKEWQDIVSGQTRL